MSRTYTEQPVPPAARLAWDYFIQAEGKPPIYMFFSPRADFDDTRAPGWVAYYGQEMYTSTWGAMCRDLIYVQSPELIRYVLDRINTEHEPGQCPRKYMFNIYCEKCKASRP